MKPTSVGRTSFWVSLLVVAMTAALCWLCLLAIASMCEGANLIPNGSFETPDTNDPWKAAGWHMVSLDRWRVTDNYLPVPDGRLSAYGNPGYWIWSSYPFGVFETGPYTLSLWARQADCDADPVTLVLQLGVNEGTYQARTTLVPNTLGEWQQYRWTFGVKTEAELWVGAFGGTGAVVVDDVRVEVVPEPAGWLVLLGGVCGWHLRRRR